jgi:phosphonate transport system substrate-binding protein
VLGSFDDLRGARWAFNEPTSHSGYGILRYTLATRADSATFFSEIVESGAHQRSIAWVVDGVVDASAIDSTVLETELRLAPELASQVRVVTTLGPSPIPPLVASRALPLQVREACRQVLLGMHRDPSARAILELGAVARFTSVVDADYDPIRDMSRAAAASDFC